MAMPVERYRAKIKVFEDKVATHKKLIAQHQREIAKLTKWLEEDSVKLQQGYANLDRMLKEAA